MAIRWRKKDVKKLKNEVRNHNRKLKILLDKADELKFDPRLLPKKLSFKEMKEEIKTREHFNNFIKITDTFTARNSENKIEKNKKGAVIPQFFIIEKDIKLKEINKTRNLIKDQYTNMLPQDRGIVQKGKLEDYDVGVNKMKDRTFNIKNKSTNEIVRFAETLKEYSLSIEDLNAAYRENYYKSIDKNYTLEEGVKLKKLLDKIPDEVLFRQSLIDENLKISFNYEELENKGQKYKSVFKGWQRVYSRYEAEQLKNDQEKREEEKIYKELIKGDVL